MDTEKTYTRITINEAIKKTKHWRNFIRKALDIKHKHDVPKGVFISSADITDLGVLCQSDPNILGVRAYFTLEKDHEKSPYKNDIKFMLVPVHQSDEHENGRDWPYMGAVDAVAEPEGTKILDDSNVFDFTRPCPDSCDTTSVFYSSKNQQ